MRQAILAAVTVIAVLASPVETQRRGLKVLLLYDMEGVSGATDVKHIDFSYPAEYQQSRTSLTADVNAAIAGLKAAGATEILVVDGHGSGNSSEPDVLVDQLLPPAVMIDRSAPFDIYMDSYDRSVDAIVAIGMHAGAGNRVGFISHTYTIEDVEYRVNGVPFNESMILAMGAARLRIPLIMVSGDDQLESEIARTMSWVRYATVKHAVDRTKAEVFARDEVSRRIEAAAREGLQNREQARFPEFPGPYRFALTFQDEDQADLAATLPGAEITGSGRAVQVRADDFEEGYRRSLRLIHLAGRVGRLEALQAVLQAQGNAQELRQQVNAWMLDRWLDRLPQDAASTGGAARPRHYWGAR